MRVHKGFWAFVKDKAGRRSDKALAAQKLNGETVDITLWLHNRVGLRGQWLQLSDAERAKYMEIDDPDFPANHPTGIIDGRTKESKKRGRTATKSTETQPEITEKMNKMVVVSSPPPPRDGRINVELTCAEYGDDGAVFTVQIDLRKDVNTLKKAIYQEQRYSSRFPFAASALTLYLARDQDGVWLKDDDDADALLRGTVNKTFVAMRASWPLDDEAYFGTSFEPASKKIQVLVARPDVPRPRHSEDDTVQPVQKKCRGLWRIRAHRARDYDNKMKYFVLDEKETEDSGLGPQMLYCRPHFHEQFKFLREQVLGSGRVGWILGPHGVGKSVTTMAFALTLHPLEWSVTWIHIDASKTWKCTRYMNSIRQTRVIDDSDVEEILTGDDFGTAHLVIVDGWADDTKLTELTARCHNWVRAADRTTQRRLVFVCSAFDRGQTSQSHGTATNAVELKVWSWTLPEYLDAVRDDTFFDSIKSNLDAHTASPVSREEIVETKYYYAGGWCEFMFKLPTRDVIRHLDRVIYRLVCCGDRDSPSWFQDDDLRAMLPDSGGNESLVRAISHYVAVKGASLLFPFTRERFPMQLPSMHSDPAFDGWSIEALFCEAIERGHPRHGSVRLTDGMAIYLWEKAALIFTDTIPDVLYQYGENDLWIKPVTWQQGGIDAMFVDLEAQLVRFVQIPRSHKRCFRLEYFARWLDRLSKEGFEVKTLEVFFLVDHSQLKGLGLTRVTGIGLLEPFGWPRGEELDRVQVVAFQE